MSSDLHGIDRTRLGRDIAALSADAIHLKTLLRTRWTRPMGDEQRRLVRVRRSLTDLFVLLALSRGRIHLRTAPRELRDAGGPSFDPAAWDPAAHARAVAARRAEEYRRAEVSGEPAGIGEGTRPSASTNLTERA